MAIREFRLPDPGEGLVEADIVTWRVAVGDQVKINDIVVEVETSKSLVELPSPYAGTVTSLLVSEGDTVDVGRPIIAIDDGVPSAAPAAEDDLVPEPPATTADAVVEPDKAGDQAPDGRVANLVGYGPKTAETKRRPRKTAAPDPASAQVHAQLAATPSRPMPPFPGGPMAARRCTPGTAARRRPLRCRVRAQRHPRRNAQPARSWPSRRFASWPRISELILVR